MLLLVPFLVLFLVPLIFGSQEEADESLSDASAWLSWLREDELQQQTWKPNETEAREDIYICIIR